MQNKRRLLLFTLALCLAYLNTNGQDATNDSKSIEAFEKYLNKAEQASHPNHPNINLGEITTTGLTLGDTNYSLKIQTIDKESLLAMPHKKVDESIHYFMPNKRVESTQQFDPKDLQTQSLLRKLNPEDFIISND